MTPINMTNEQFALWVASNTVMNRDVQLERADQLYGWLEAKRKRIGLPNTTVPQPDMSKKPTLHDPKDALREDGWSQKPLSEGDQKTADGYVVRSNNI